MVYFLKRLLLPNATKENSLQTRTCVLCTPEYKSEYTKIITT